MTGKYRLCSVGLINYLPVCDWDLRKNVLQHVNIVAIEDCWIYIRPLRH